MNTRNTFLIGVAAASIALAGCATSPGYSGGGYSSPGYGSSTASCYDCGTVTRIELVRASTGGPAGAILGGIVGAVAGHEISAHTGGSKGNQNVA
ncbi:MAG TPA: peptidoglycan-associated outer membrane lipoprotein precursor, partial [Lysobacter sp.]|nr:peptidoglycan-associated outer membrane lipoprotein precursor [Lysobacter sp.]